MIDYSFDDILIFDDLLIEKCLREMFREFYKSENWSLQISGDESINICNPNCAMFWRLNLENDSPVIQSIFRKIEKKSNKSFILDSCYVNAQSSIQDGSIHNDKFYDGKNQPYTFILYINPVWHTTWGGCTVFLNSFIDVDGKTKRFKYSKVEESIRILPKPGTGILFPANILHYAEGPSKEYRGLRMSLAFKMIETTNNAKEL